MRKVLLSGGRDAWGTGRRWVRVGVEGFAKLRLLHPAEPLVDRCEPAACRVRKVLA